MTNTRFLARVAACGLMAALSVSALSVGALLGSAAPLAAQTEGNLFAPRLRVNGKVITEYEVQQRAQFLRLLRAPVDPDAEAIKALTEDRLRIDEAERLGLQVTPETVTAAMEEFAARANLSAAEFIGALEQAGVSEATFRDFVSAGSIWREVVRTRYLSQVTVSEADIDKAINGAARQKPLRILVSELVIPLPEGQDTTEAKALATRLSKEISGEGAFAQAARRYSASPTGGSGGRLDWMPLANLPPQITPFVLGLEPGQVSDPVFVPNAVVLFLLRDIAEDAAAETRPVQVEYAEYLIPDSAEEIARLRASNDSCMDLYAEAKGLPDSRLTVSTRPMGEIPQDVGMELAKLDPGESSVALTRGGARLFLMLCNRSPIEEAAPNREAIRENIVNRKLEGLSEAYLEELRAVANIREP